MEKEITCTYNGEDYSEGSVTCQNNTEYVCQDGQWNPTGKDCSDKAKSLTSETDEISSQLKNEKKASLGCCVYPDINDPGTYLCADNWDEFQCQQAGGTFYEGQTCDDVNK